jgi:integrase
MTKRPREYLKEPEIERLTEAARQNRWGHRDATAILLAYRHGLRASELVSLRWDDLDLAHGRLHVRRSKGGETAVHPIGGKEMRALRRLQREAMTKSVYVFISERGAPLSLAGYQRMVARARKGSQISLPDPQPHAAPQYWLQACQRRPRHARNPRLPRPPLDRVNATIHGLGTRQVQTVLEGLRLPAVAALRTC